MNELNKFLYQFHRQALHATTLQFYHPITAMNMRFDAPLPKDMVNLLEYLRKNSFSNLN